MKAGAALIGWSALTVLFGYAILISYTSRHPGSAPTSAPTPTIAEACPERVVTADEEYLKNDMICAEMHKGTFGDDMKDWTVVYIVGTHSTAIFQYSGDAISWALREPYVRRKDQVR